VDGAAVLDGAPDPTLLDSAVPEPAAGGVAKPWHAVSGRAAAISSTAVRARPTALLGRVQLPSIVAGRGSGRAVPSSGRYPAEAATLAG
jgi:hypothetical protein